MASLTFQFGSTEHREDSYNEFLVGKDLAFKNFEPFTYSPTTDNIHSFMNEFADDGSADGAYSSLVTFSTVANAGSGKLEVGFRYTCRVF